MRRFEWSPGKSKLMGCLVGDGVVPKKKSAPKHPPCWATDQWISLLPRTPVPIQVGQPEGGTAAPMGGTGVGVQCVGCARVWGRNCSMLRTESASRGQGAAAVLGEAQRLGAAPSMG